MIENRTEQADWVTTIVNENILATVTVNEAKTKWCPFARVAVGDSGNRAYTGANRMWPDTAAHLDWARCVAGECMCFIPAGNEIRFDENGNASNEDVFRCGLSR